MADTLTESMQRTGRSLGVIATLLLAAILCFGWVPSATAQPPRILLKHPHVFRVAASAPVYAAGDYQLVANGFTPVAKGGVLLNLRTGARTIVRLPHGCYDDVLSSSALLYKCPLMATGTFGIYDLDLAPLAQSPLVATLPSWGPAGPDWRSRLIRPLTPPSRRSTRISRRGR